MRRKIDEEMDTVRYAPFRVVQHIVDYISEDMGSGGTMEYAFIARKKGSKDGRLYYRASFNADDMAGFKKLLSDAIESVDDVEKNGITCPFCDHLTLNFKEGICDDCLHKQELGIALDEQDGGVVKREG